MDCIWKVREADVFNGTHAVASPLPNPPHDDEDRNQRQKPDSGIQPYLGGTRPNLTGAVEGSAADWKRSPGFDWIGPAISVSGAFPASARSISVSFTSDTGAANR